MAESSNDFGLLEGVGAEAVGQPGQRTFRLIARSDTASASLWMEKEQLTALGTAIQQQIVRLGRPAARERPVPLISGSDIPQRPDVEFHLGQIGLGFDETKDEFVVVAYPVDREETAESGWTGHLTLAQARSLSREIERVVNAGRPRCPLCGLLIEGPIHSCPRSNGHAKEFASG
jgi:uncharacterized repeat protein (TIGR03847 family)